MRWRSVLPVGTAIALSLTACAGDSGSSAKRRASAFPAHLAVADSVTLDDGGDGRISEPTGVATSDRYLFVGDANTSTILQFDRAGRFVRRIGRRGRGPGELTAPSAIVALGDTAIAVADVAAGMVLVFGTEAGEFRGATHVAGSPLMIDVSRDTVLGATYDAMQHASLYQIRLGDSVGRAFGPISPDYKASERIRFAYPFSAAAYFPGGIVVGMIGSRRLYRTDAGGTPVDSVELMHLRRRGVPDDLERKLAESRGAGREMLLASMLLAMTTMDSSTVMLHGDFTPNGQSVSIKAHLSIVDWRTHRQCVDAEVGVSSDSRPAFAFRRDTLVVVQDLIAPTEPATATTMVRLFAVPRCE